MAHTQNAHPIPDDPIPDDVRIGGNDFAQIGSRHQTAAMRKKLQSVHDFYQPMHQAHRRAGIEFGKISGSPRDLTQRGRRPNNAHVSTDGWRNIVAFRQCQQPGAHPLMRHAQPGFDCRVSRRIRRRFGCGVKRNIENGFNLGLGHGTLT